MKQPTSSLDSGASRGAEEQEVKEKREVIVTALRNRTLHPFFSSLVYVKTLKQAIARAILEYDDNGDPITHINQHKASLLWKTDNKLRNSYHIAVTETLEELAIKAKGFIDL